MKGLFIAISFKTLSAAYWPPSQAVGQEIFYSDSEIRLASKIPKLPSPSYEQRVVFHSLFIDKCNVMLNAVAGSGKTTTALYVALTDPNKSILLITYNKRLKEDVRVKTKTYGINNLEAHSYHALGVRVYDPTCFRDDGILTVIQSNMSMKVERQKKYDILIIDEAQDMNILYYLFMCKFLSDQFNLTRKLPLILIIGDAYQTIYDFKDADARYLTKAERLFPFNSNSWKALALSTSYRLTANMAKFVNYVMVGRKNIHAYKSEGNPVQYLVGNQFKSAEYIGAEILRFIRSGLLRPDDVFILAPSIKSRGKSPLRVLENMLVENAIPVHVPSDDNSALDDDTTNGKVLFSSFHQCKGLERAMVVVFSFEASYFKYYARDVDSSFCPCVLYVATTRATSDLYLVAEAKEGEHLPFLRRELLNELAASSNPCVVVKCFSGFNQSSTTVGSSTTDTQSPLLSVKGWTTSFLQPLISYAKKLVSMVRPARKEDSYPLPDDHEVSLSATTLTRYLPELTVSKALKLLNPVTLRHKQSLIRIPVKVGGSLGGKELVESVSDLNGLAIPAMLEVECGDVPECSMFNQLLAVSNTDVENRRMHPKILQHFKRLREPKDMETPAHFLELAAIYQAGAGIGSRGYISKATQLKSFAWMSQQQADACLTVLRGALGGEIDRHPPEFEYMILKQLEYTSAKEGTVNVTIAGSVDILTPATLWEIKCVTEIDSAHLLQLGVYAWLWNKEKRKALGDRQFRLLNVLTGEIVQINCNKLDEFVELLLKTHFRSNKKLDDAEFLKGALYSARMFFPPAA